MSKLTIRGGPAGEDIKILLDGKPLDNCSGFTLRGNANETTTVSLELDVEVDIEADVEVEPGVTPAERTQLAAALGAAEAVERQAEALQHFAAGLRSSIEGLLIGAARESGGESSETGSGEERAVRRQYLGGQELLEGSTKLHRAPRPVTGERSRADPGANAQPPQE